ARQGLTIFEALRLAKRVAEALGVAHKQGVVHRDVKPSNIFLRSGDVEQAVVLDFGVARPAEMNSVLTRTGAVVGTPGYMSPEQARGDREIDARADVFSLGGVLFKCLTGQAAFAAESVVAQLAKILFYEAPHVRELRPGVPLELDDLVARMLAKEASRRP